jgi:putative protein-disulfide isomerase
MVGRIASTKMSDQATLLYVVDPMCSWCWGFAPTIAALRERYPVQLVLGGLAPDSSEPMPPEMRAYVQQAWHDVAAASGAAFNFDFWQQCEPRRSTYPANRAVVLARRLGLEWQMLEAIQHAYYLHARNPSEVTVLADLAAGLGMDRGKFIDQVDADSTQSELEQDFDLRRSIGANSFPSIGLRGINERGGSAQLIHAGWVTLDQIRVKLEPWNTNQASPGD